MTEARQPDTAAGRAGPVAGPARRGTLKRPWVGFVFVLPMLVLFLLFRFLPAIGAFFLSLTDYRISGKWDFIALDNYTRLLSDKVFHEALLVTITYTVIFVPLTVLLSLGTAVLLHQVVWRRGFFRGVFFLPYVTSIVLAAVIWKWIYDAQDGLLNGVLGLVSIGPVDFLGQSGSVLPSIAVTSAWKGFGYSMLILLAGLQGQDKGILEAAQVDGAGTWRTFTWITLPHLRMYIEIGVLLGSVIILQVFDPIAILTKGTGGTKTLAYLLYERAFIGLDVGQAAAYGVVTVVLTIIVATIALKSVFKVFMAGGSR